MTGTPPMSGPELFARYAFPPNVHGYCGPADSGLMEELRSSAGLAEFTNVVQQFEGAWPYLELLGGLAGLDPLDRKVVEAYWVGNDLLSGFDTLAWGNSVDERFRSRAGRAWTDLESGITDGVPNHAFHVFCVYPWVGLLQSGYADHALEVIDRCRIRWGRVVANVGDTLVVESRPLTWDGAALALGNERSETVSVTGGSDSFRPGDVVSLHWDYVCDRLDRRNLRSLEQVTLQHLAIVNRSRRDLAGVIER